MGTYVKAKIWSKAPPTETQTNSLVSFGYLQRFSSAIAKYTPNTPFIRESSMSYYNAVCQKFKTCLQNHAFVPEACETVFSTVDPYTLTISSLNLDEGKLTVALSCPDTSIAKNRRIIKMWVFNENMKCQTYDYMTAEATQASFQWQPQFLTDGYLLCIEMLENVKTFFPQNHQRKRFPYVWRNVTLTTLE